MNSIAFGNHDENYSFITAESAVFFYSLSSWCLVSKVAECRHDANIDTEQVGWETIEGTDNRGEYFIEFDVRKSNVLALYVMSSNDEEICST